MRIAVVGTGAMACLFAAKLAPQADVVMLGAWQEGVRALQARGLFLKENERVTRFPINAYGDPSQVEPLDVALVLVKGYQTPRAARWAAHLLRPTGLALTLQNGLGNLEIIAAQVGAHRAALGVTMQGATMIKPGCVRHGGEGPTTIAATFETRARLDTVAGLFRRAGMQTNVTDDVQALVWGKLVVNSAINALTAILLVPNGRLAEDNDTRAVMAAIALETASVARAVGVALPFDDPAERAIAVARATGSNFSSTLQDVLRGTPDELDQINGAVIREGRRLGIPTPLNEGLLRLARQVKGPEAAPVTARSILSLVEGFTEAAPIAD
jgi:2-dehydropantoate 2-reductase